MITILQWKKQGAAAPGRPGEKRDIDKVENDIGVDVEDREDVDDMNMVGMSNVWQQHHRHVEIEHRYDQAATKGISTVDPLIVYSIVAPLLARCRCVVGVYLLYQHSLVFGLP